MPTRLTLRCDHFCFSIRQTGIDSEACMHNFGSTPARDLSWA